MASRGFTRRWRVLHVTDPAAGADWSTTAPGSAARRIVSLHARLVASAAVANRQVALIASSSAGRWYQQAWSVTQTAGQTVDYGAHTAAGTAGAAPGTASVPLPAAGLLLLPGFQLSVVTTGIDVADQWSGVNLLIDEIPSDVPYVGEFGPITLEDLGA